MVGIVNKSSHRAHQKNGLFKIKIYLQVLSRDSQGRTSIDLSLIPKKKGTLAVTKKVFLQTTLLLHTIIRFPRDWGIPLSNVTVRFILFVPAKVHSGFCVRFFYGLEDGLQVDMKEKKNQVSCWKKKKFFMCRCTWRVHWFSCSQVSGVPENFFFSFTWKKNIWQVLFSLRYFFFLFFFHFWMVTHSFPFVKFFRAFVYPQKTCFSISKLFLEFFFFEINPQVPPSNFEKNDFIYKIAIVVSLWAVGVRR